MSVTKQCRDLNVGEFTYIECESVKQSNNVTRRMGDNSRLPGEMKNFNFSCMTFTAIALQSGEVTYLNKVTRTK